MKIEYKSRHKGMISRYAETYLERFHYFLELHRDKNKFNFSGKLTESEDDFGKLLKILEKYFLYKNFIIMLQQIINFCEVISEIRKNELSAHINSKEFKANYSYHWSVSYSSKDEMIVLLIWSKTKKIKIDSSQLDCIYLFALAASKLLDEETSSGMISYYDDVLLEMRKIKINIEEEEIQNEKRITKKK